jgi:Secretion system C-terminal sorting domain
LPERSHVSLAVYNSLGKQVTQLIKGDVEAGYHDVKFDASSLPSGVYFYRMPSGDYTEVKKLLLVR